MVVRWIYLGWRNMYVKRFLGNARRCRAVQHKVLFRKLRRNRESRFGRDHGFSHIRSVADFRRSVPITSYDYYQPYVDRVKKGELGAMFGPGTKLLMFALTSGTTNQPKYIPVTQQFYDEYQTGWNMWGIRTYLDHMDLCRKKTIQLSSDWSQSYTEGGIPCGAISGLAAETAPLISRPLFILPKPLIKIHDPLAKRYTALRLSLVSRRVGMVITANPSTLVGLARLADAYRESLIRDLFDGTLSPQMAVPPKVHDLLGRRLRPHPQRARELDSIVERTDTLYPRDFWPRMSVLAVWMGGSVGAYLSQLEEYYGKVAFRDHGLSASEGRMTLPLRDGTSAGILDFTSSFFEFVPEEEHEAPSPSALEAHELEVGRNYYILMTTSSGLYRYDIHDLVRCVGFEGTAPVLEFLNKGAHFSNVTGEKLSEFQVVSAVKSSFAELGIPFETFTVAPVFGDPSGYVLLIERDLSEQKEEQLARKVNDYLARLNCEYAERLASRRLKPLSVRKVPPGTWIRFRDERLASRGGSFEQYKHPCLVNDLAFVDELFRRESSPHRHDISMAKQRF